MRSEVVKRIVEFNRDHIENVTAIFNAIMGEHFHWGYFYEKNYDLHQAQNALIDLIADKAGITSTSRVLDIGCGIGGTAIYLSNNYRCSVFGITNSTTGIQIANDKSRSITLNPVPEFQEMDALDVHLPNSSFDAIICIETAYMIPDKSKLLSEMYRLLKPCGIMVIADNMVLRKLNKEEMINNISSIQALQNIFGRGDYISMSEYIQLAKKADFEQALIKDITDHVLPTTEHVLKIIDQNIQFLNSHFDDTTVCDFRACWVYTKMLYLNKISNYGLIIAHKSQ